MADKLISDLPSVAAHTSAAKIEVDAAGTAGYVTVLQLLSGRSGGTTFIGGTASADKLKLKSTSHATRGELAVLDNILKLGQGDATTGDLLSLNGTGVVADGAYVLLDKVDGDDDAVIAYRSGGAIKWFEGLGGAAGGGTLDWALQQASGAAGAETLDPVLTAIASSGHLKTGTDSFFGIGTAPTEALHVATTNARALFQGTAETRVVVKAGATQTENLFEVRDSAGVLQSYCDSAFVWHGITVEGADTSVTNITVTDTTTTVNLIAQESDFRHVTVDDPNSPAGTGDSWLRINLGELQATSPFTIYDADESTLSFEIVATVGASPEVRLYPVGQVNPAEYVSFNPLSVAANGGSARTSLQVTEYYNGTPRLRFAATSTNSNGTTGGAYTVTNLVTDRTYDADATSTAELADVLGTLITDLGVTAGHSMETLDLVVDGVVYTVLVLSSTPETP